MIDGKKLIEKIRREGILGCGHSDSESVENVIDMIESQEIIGEWIPCSERLPEYENEEYMVVSECYGEYLYQILTFACGWNCARYSDGTINRKHEIKNIIAWMPITEYRPSED